MKLNNNLKKICFLKKDTTRVGFTSKEFEDACGTGDFKNVMNNMVLTKIKKDIEGRCIGDGYVIPGSVKIIERGRLTFPHEALQLHYSTRVNYEYVLCNPNPGYILECKIYTKNKIGIIASIEDKLSPLVILVPDDLCDTPEKRLILKGAVPGKKIWVSVLGKKFEQNDKKITVIATIVDGFEENVDVNNEEKDFDINDEEDVNDEEDNNDDNIEEDNNDEDNDNDDNDEDLM